MKNLILIIVTLLAAFSVQAKSKDVRSSIQNRAKVIDVDQQLNGLGSNEEIIKKARALQPHNNMSIVQKRQVDRHLRLEVGGSFGLVNGGDSYVDTRNWGGQVDFHINPRWSVGLRYFDYKNELTNEGKRVFDQAVLAQQQNQLSPAPSIDFPLRSYMAMLNWYPVYGKVSWLESAVSQFDFYLTAGGGQIDLNSGHSTIYSGGAGMAMWINSWLTSRIEVRYQNYKDRISTGDRNIDSMVLQLGIGFML